MEIRGDQILDWCENFLSSKGTAEITKGKISKHFTCKLQFLQNCLTGK